MQEQIEAYWQLKHAELLTDHNRLKELYDQQQTIIEAYQRHIHKRDTVRRMFFGFDEGNTGVS